jgi:predicted nucleotidyltransferase component of viral defense system
MTKKNEPNLAASVRQRLLNLSQQRQETFDFVLAQYAIERFLFRLGQSPFAHQFILKGATLFTVWSGKLHRPTRDIDLLGYTENSDEQLRELFATLCRLPVEADGLSFDAGSIRIGEIRELQAYGGKRISLLARLDTAVIPLQIDLAFGDVVTPSATWLSYPTLLSFPEPNVRAYPKESVVAEKLQAMVMLGMLNSRMKDYYDLWVLCRQFSFDGETLTEALRATFSRRQTVITPNIPIALTAEFAEHPDKMKQWQAFLNRNRLETNETALLEVLTQLQHFLLPPWQAIANDQPFQATWTARGPWQMTG